MPDHKLGNLPGTPLYLDRLNESATDAVEGNITDLTSDLVDLGEEVDAIDTDIGAGTITNAEISPSAAIAYSKLNLANSIVSSDIATGTIADTDIASAAAISYSKLNLSGSVTNGDLAGGIKGNNLALNIGPSPPSSPSNGDLWIYTDSPGTGYYWMFVYDSSETTYKWKFIGGAPLIGENSSDNTFTDNGTVQDASTPGPSVTLPRAGDYEVVAQAALFFATQAALRVMEHFCVASSGTWLNGTATSVFASNETTAGRLIAGSGKNRLRGASASATITMKYVAETDTGTAHTSDRAIYVKPIRVI